MKLPLHEVAKYERPFSSINLGNKRRKHCRYNDEFSVIDSEIKAYCLGLLFSDGSVSVFNNGEKSKDYSIKLSLSYEDLPTLIKLKEAFPFFQAGNFDYSKYNPVCVVQHYLRYSGIYLYNDLIKHGIVNRKSYENKENLHFPTTIPDELMHHFVRGFFDGDGSISIAKNRPNLRRADICGVTNSFIRELYNWFALNGCEPQAFREKKGNIQRVYLIEWWKTEDMQNLGKLLYKNATIYFDRKKNLFDSLHRVDLTDKGLLCPACRHDKCKSNGKRMMAKGLAYRYECKQCNNQFTLYNNQAQIKSCELLENPEVDNQQPSAVEIQ